MVWCVFPAVYKYFDFIDQNHVFDRKSKMCHSTPEISGIVHLQRVLVYKCLISNVPFWFFSTRWPTSFRNVSKLLILPYNLVWTTTSCCGTRISKHFRNLRSQNLHQNLARVDQFSKGFGVYIFGIKYFILVFLRFPARFIGNVSELFISQYDLVGTSTFWCNTEMSGHSHFFRLPKFPSKTFQNRSVW